MAGMSETTKNASPSLLRYSERRTCEPGCRWARSLFFRRGWNPKNPNGAISHELAQRSSRNGRHGAEISVRVADGLHPDSIFYRGNVVDHQPGMVGISQDLGRYFSMAGFAISDPCLAVRKASRRPHCSRIAADLADRVAICSGASGTRWPLVDRHRTPCRPRRIDVDCRDRADARMA